MNLWHTHPSNIAPFEKIFPPYPRCVHFSSCTTVPNLNVPFKLLKVRDYITKSCKHRGRNNIEMYTFAAQEKAKSGTITIRSLYLSAFQMNKFWVLHKLSRVYKSWTDIQRSCFFLCIQITRKCAVGLWCLQITKLSLLTHNDQIPIISFHTHFLYFLLPRYFLAIMTVSETKFNWFNLRFSLESSANIMTKLRTG